MKRNNDRNLDRGLLPSCFRWRIFSFNRKVIPTTCPLFLYSIFWPMQCFTILFFFTWYIYAMAISLWRCIRKSCFWWKLSPTPCCGLLFAPTHPDMFRMERDKWRLPKPEKKSLLSAIHAFRVRLLIFQGCMSHRIHGWYIYLQGGPLPVMSGVATRIRRVITPIYTVTGRGPTLYIWLSFWG